jgi:hypothetical protein
VFLFFIFSDTVLRQFIARNTSEGCSSSSRERETESEERQRGRFSLVGVVSTTWVRHSSVAPKLRERDKREGGREVLLAIKK